MPASSCFIAADSASCSSFLAACKSNAAYLPTFGSASADRTAVRAFSSAGFVVGVEAQPAKVIAAAMAAKSLVFMKCPY